MAKGSSRKGSDKQPAPSADARKASAPSKGASKGSSKGAGGKAGKAAPAAAGKRTSRRSKGSSRGSSKRGLDSSCDESTVDVSTLDEADVTLPRYAMKDGDKIAGRRADGTLPMDKSRRRRRSSRAAAAAPRPSGAGDGTFVYWAAVAQVIIIVLFGVFVRYSADSGVHAAISSAMTSSEPYPLITDVHVMVFVGFGFLMTFMRRYAFGGVSFVMLIAVLCVQWYILVGGFWHAVINDAWSHKVTVDVKKLLLADFAAASMLISFGGVMGKLSVTQLLIAAIVHITLYALNETISLYMGISDIGGSMVIHTFGAYFGLALSAVTTRASDKRLSAAGVAGSDINSDVFAMVGTMFLFCFWPSFNAAPSASGNQRNRAITNTILALSASAFAAFIASNFFRRHRKFFMVDIQNATLAGGVAIGAVADMAVEPVGALIIGLVSGLVSVAGFARLQGFLERTTGLHDSAGINNLHGMPGMMGGVASAIMAGLATTDFYGGNTDAIVNVYARRATRTPARQAWMQIAFLAITLGISLGGGLLAGVLVRFAPKCCVQRVEFAFEDGDVWEVPTGPTDAPVVDAAPAKKDEEDDDELTNISSS